MIDTPRRSTTLEPPARRPGLVAAIAWTLGLWVIALGATIVMEPYIRRSIFLFFWVAVLGAAWRVGLGAAMASVVATVLVVNYLFLEPVGAFTVRPADLLQAALFMGVSGAVSALVGRLDVAQRRTAEDALLQAQLNDQLQDQAIELEQQREEAEALAAEAEMARDEAESANRAKAEFLATMSHELRTPINAALGYVDLLEAGIHGPLTAPQRESLARVRRSQRRLLTLVTDVLSFTRLESARLELTLADVAVASLLPEVMEQIQPVAEGRRVRVRCDPTDGALVAHADRDRLEQVLLNLLSNAVKFTPADGEVVLSCDATPTSVLLRVRDTGRGIDPAHHERIFEPFVQVEQGLTRSAEGTGLGLAISRGLARAMGGNVTVESAPGAGATFTLTLPRAGVASGMTDDARSAAMS